MGENHSKELFSKLINNIIDSDNVSIFMGAGCSLTSSKRDITSYGIIKDLVQNHLEDKVAPENWVKLYECFVNNVWNGQGNQNKIQLLKKYFENMSPSVGYTTLRWLVENNYINNIITTNFDLMIDVVLDGFSYNLIVGNKTIRYDENCKTTVIKAHGDLNHGELRFSPKELIKLPNDLCNKITLCTKGTLLVTGYRGQDTGVLDAIDKSGEYNAYWTSINEIDKFDDYYNHKIFSLMNSRNSENNYLFGDNYGKFDNLLLNIKEKIQRKAELKHKYKIKKIGNIWSNCSLIFSHLKSNRRINKIFDDVFSIFYKLIEKKEWNAEYPYFCSSYVSMIKKVVDVLSANFWPDNLLGCITNEVDALVFSLSVSLNFASFGYNYDSKKMISIIRNELLSKNSEISINEEFWNIVIKLSQITIKSDCFNDKNKPIIFCFDKLSNLQTILRFVDIPGMYKLITTIQILLTFFQTSERASENISLYKSKRLIEKNLYAVNKAQNKIKLQMTNMSVKEYEMLKNYFFSDIFVEHCIDDERILVYNNIHANFTLDKIVGINNLNLWDEIFAFAKSKRESFYCNFKKEKNILRDHIKIFNDFLNSSSNGLFIIGNSGSGKTTSLKLWSSILNDYEYCICPLSGREFNNNDEIEWFYSSDNLTTLNQMLYQRNQTFILIIDAINEMYGTFTEISTFYKKSIDLCNYLSKKQFKNIKIVMSTRTDFYHQLKSHTNIEPSCNSFFSFYSENTQKINSVFEIPLLKQDEISLFIKLLNKNNSINKQMLVKEFGDLVTLPFNLKLICEIGNSERNAYKLNDDIYEIWFNKISSLASNEGITVNNILSIINKVLEYKYFISSDRVEQTYMIFSSLSNNTTDISLTYKWLLEQHVFINNAANPNLIQFYHDKIEEYFLYRYIISNYVDKLKNIDSLLKYEILESPILKQSLYKTIINLYENEKLVFITNLIGIINNSNLIKIWIDAILLLLYRYPNNTCDIIQQVEQYVVKETYSNFIEYILHYINEKIDNMEYVAVEAIRCFSKIISKTNCYTNQTLNVYIRYLEAKCLFAFADKSDSQVFKKALTICNDIENMLDDNIAINFKDAFQFLKALLLQNQGYLNDSISLMEKCYKNQLSKAAYNLACKSAVHLGAMYREMTRFDDAILLYESINTEYITDLEFKHRLIMNKGIIYKNKIQNSQFSGDNNTKINVEYYSLALESFQKTYNYAVDADNVKLLLEICAEFVELSCIAFNMNIGTINEAYAWGKKIDLYITRCDVPVERIQRHRMWARILTISCKYEDAIKHLEKGFDIAYKYGISFRAADCYSQIAGIIYTMIKGKYVVTKELLEKARKCNAYAIKYYKSLSNPNHRYLNDALIKEKAINDCLNSLMET